jgi:hypothetical protein
VEDIVAPRSLLVRLITERDEVGQLRAALQVLAGGERQSIRLVRDPRHVAGNVVKRYAAVPSLSRLL